MERTRAMISKSSVHSQNVYRETLDRLIGFGTRWLDIGCGHTILPDWMRDTVPIQKELLSRCEFAIGCDPADERPHVAGLKKLIHRGEHLPFEDETFNLVTANMVAEHVEDPASFTREIRRVLCPGGLFVVHTPNLFYFEVFAAHLLPNRLVRAIAHRVDGREEEDIFPTRYRMNTSAAFQRLPGFKIVDLNCVETAPQFGKIPLLNIAESALIHLTQFEAMRHLRADWIAVLQKDEAAVYDDLHAFPTCEAET
jgi:SAM-dependent methyltransferase